MTVHVYAASAGDAAAAAAERESGLGLHEPATVRSDGGLRYSRHLAATRAEGPGLRSAVWVQGCSIHCPGCFNPHLWAARGAQRQDAATLARAWVDAAWAEGVEGITLLGGEPLDQAAPLAVVAEAFRAAGLSVMTFTGYPWERVCALAARRDDIARLIGATDLICDGPYLRDLPDRRRPWIGSANQGIRALSPRYADTVQAFDDHGGGDRLEVRIAPDGSVAVNGWASDDALHALLDDLGRRADTPSAVRTHPTMEVLP